MEWHLKPVTAFSQYEDDWNRLNATHHDQAILHSSFVKALIEHFMDGSETLCVGTQNGRIKALGFLQRRRLGQWQTVMPSQAPLGLFLFENHRFCHADVKALAKALPGLVLMIDFLQVDTDGLTLETDPHFETQPYIETGRLAIPGDYEAYFASLSKNTRQNSKRIGNRLEKEGKEVAISRLTDPEAIREALWEYGDIESRSWKAEHGTAISKTNAQGRFYESLLCSRPSHDISPEAWLYRINNETAAVDLCVRRKNTLVILKTTYTDDFKQYSPAMQLKFEMIKHYASSDDNLASIEFFGKAMDWHRKLTENIREIRHITLMSVFGRYVLKLKTMF
ncbi:MAG: GNAT family N-acetyltransferase [Pseudomonadales bacterium]